MFVTVFTTSTYKTILNMRHNIVQQSACTHTDTVPESHWKSVTFPLATDIQTEIYVKNRRLYK